MNEIATIEPTTMVPADDAGITGLVRLALEQKADVGVLERLVALQERITDRNARAAFFEAMAKFREECPPILKTRENSQFSVTRNGTKQSARYAPLEEIDRVVRPIASKHGLIWTWDTRIDGDHMHVDCRVIHIAGHSETATVTMPHGSNAGSSPQQKFGSTQSYGMRYSLVAALGITTADEDNDGNQPGQTPKTITEAQVADLDAMITEVKADRAGFLRYMKVEKLEDILIANMPMAIRLLEEKRRRG